ncbi:heat stress transcription factor A-8 [Abrus precatorius]|uniref:Heat stress transcription factor A-8 n=1 Tax=Abrus precatorius TaxID=3816 RepID=A0A8B8KEY2_ABRPR|nr:heat stress transcription factor A-8 [Abrus precatorius]
MVKSNDNGSGSGSVAPFLKKCYDMVEDQKTESIISWSEGGDSFVILDITEFSVTLLPTYFKHNNFSSFIRQLNIYGFRKIDTDRWEFANENFVRGQKDLLKNIRRRKHPHTVDQQKALPQQDNCEEPSHESPHHGLWKEVENLKSDKNSLMQELVKLRQHQESSDNKLLLLSDRLQGMEKHQQQMLSFLVMVVQSPGFMVQLLQPKENNWRLAEPGNILDQDKQDDRPVTSDGMIIKYKPPVGEKLKPVVPLSPGFDKQPEPEISVDGLKDLCISSEFLKVLQDEKLCPLENHSPFLLPDLPDDGSWEQLFLGSPFLANIQDSNNDSEGCPVSGTEMEPIISETPDESCRTFESMIVEMEKIGKE